MKVALTGATGLIGTALTTRLESEGHEVVVLRRPTDWDPDNDFINIERLSNADAVVHLAGENIAAGRWTVARKERILKSRTLGTALLASALSRMPAPPKVLVSASAIGYYGDRAEAPLTENDGPGTGFLPEVCTAWEAATAPAASRGIRTVQLRIGIVLATEGGALAKMRRPFLLGAGGVFGSGSQYMSWITLEDLCRAIIHTLGTPSLAGPVNAVSPHPATNRDFTRSLARTLWRPAVLPVPALAVRLVLGELADALLLASARVLPAKLLQSGFVFRDEDLDVTLARLMHRVSTLESSQWLARPLEEVFPFFASAGNLDSITPPWLRFHVENPATAIRQGTFLNYRLKLHGIPIRWRSEILVWEPPYRFVDVQRNGPYTLWYHEHSFRSHRDGTLVEDRVEYAAPGGSLIRRLFIEKDLERIFRFRKAKLEQIFA